MTMTITCNDPLGDIVTRHPASAVVLHRHRLDFCCGGERSLASACAARSLDPATVLDEIRSVTEREGHQETDSWTTRPLAELIDHILTVYHEPLRRELPELISMADRVEQVYALKQGCPHGLGDHLRGILDAVLSHLAKEEQILFPAILAGQGSACGGPVQVMMAEHDDHGENLRRTRALTGDLTPPEDACTTFRVLYQRLVTLEEDLMRHIHLENHILFPRALRGE